MNSSKAITDPTSRRQAMGSRAWTVEEYRSQSTCTYDMERDTEEQGFQGKEGGGGGHKEE